MEGQRVEGRRDGWMEGRRVKGLRRMEGWRDEGMDGRRMEVRRDGGTGWRDVGWRAFGAMCCTNVINLYL